MHSITAERLTAPSPIRLLTSPRALLKQAIKTDFFYEPDHNYYKKVESGRQGASTTVIVGAYEKETKGTVVTHRVHVGDSVLIETKNNVQSTLFLIKDHLGFLVGLHRPFTCRWCGADSHERAYV